METIKQTVLFKAQPHELFEALLDSKKHSEFTGAKATISRKVGGRFSAWDGYCSGKNLKITKDKLIVQQWRANDWPKGHYSVASFEFVAQKGGTKLNFMQTDVPEAHLKDIANGWQEYYWQPLKKYFK